ncbi:MAG TPA: winged helix-turn-helix domain-containing protein [Polyangiaceae bacterium]|nr:winged helix-turn-helix domain-containing protein [Polyangiaceae bacterium]
MPAVPNFYEFMNPVLAVLRRLGRPATIAELEAATVEEMKRAGQLSEEAARVPHNPEKSDSQSEAGYRIAWARTYLKKAGLITNPTHGSWTLTDRGRQAGSIDAHAVSREVVKAQESSKENPLLRNALGLHPVVARRLHAGYEEMLPELPAREELEANYAAFRRRFGPSVLEGLDGEELLLRMHDRGTKESLVYWLEFKNDDEFPARFGSISGGSALKFGMYRSAETGRWMTGHPTKQVPMSVADAVDLARQQRDELIAGARVLEQHASRGGQPDYAAIQRDLEAAAPKLYDTAWGHKYFCLVRPDLIDDFHSTDWQRHHLRRLLRPMPAGRYEAASFFRELALALEAPINSISGLMNHVHGGPQQYWRFDLRGRTELWSSMLARGACPYELSGLPDQTGTPSGSAGRRLLRDAVREVLGEEREPVARELYWFLHTMGLGDRILVMDGSRVRAIGEVKGDAAFSADLGQHQRLVEWLDGGAWELPGLEGEDARLLLLPKEAEYLIEVERRLLEPEPPVPVGPVPLGPGTTPPPSLPLAPLTGVLARVQLALARKRQVVLYGPPGTGKTHWATLAVGTVSEMRGVSIAAFRVGGARMEGVSAAPG